MNKLLSVIIPVYNTELYIEECLTSIISSEYENLEIICINDCSTDNSLEIIKKYANKDKRIKIINKIVNEGAQEAREIGYNICKGELITNIDSDDKILSDTFKKVIEDMEKNECDVGLFDSYYWNYKEKENLKRISKIKSGEILTGIEAFEYSLDWSIGGNGIFKREVLFNSKRIPMLYNGDEVITRNIFINSKKIILSNGKYFYRNNENSLTKNKNFNLRRIEILLSNIAIENIILSNNLYNKRTNTFRISKIRNTISTMRKILKNYYKLNKVEKKKIEKIINETMKSIDYKWFTFYLIKNFKLRKAIHYNLSLFFYYKKIKHKLRDIY